MTSKGKGPFCPECDRPATGNFCPHCGTSLGGRYCNQCGGKLSAGARFCNQCGAKVSAGGGAKTGARREAAASVFAGQNLAWWIAGAAMFVLIVVVGVSMVRPGPGPTPGSPPPAAGAAAGAAGAAPDLSTMTPIEAADRLYDRVMRSVSSGDSVQAQAFLPMAIAAYQRAQPLDADGLFHLSMLNRTAGNLEAALVQALEILEEDPNHLLGRSAAAQAAVELGELEEAEEHYRVILDVYDEEMQRDLQEYQLHAQIVTTLPAEAETFLASR
ncbi:MAG: zinc ribbon domain-containing protein [Longimicrobiales bacterium]|nr:zinc ribbon domain-containing protein [Longimicrobiales bacterium]